MPKAVSGFSRRVSCWDILISLGILFVAIFYIFLQISRSNWWAEIPVRSERAHPSWKKYSHCQFHRCWTAQSGSSNHHTWRILQVKLSRWNIQLCYVVSNVRYIFRVYPFLCRAVRNFAKDRSQIPASKEFYVSFSDVPAVYKYLVAFNDSRIF